MMTMSAKHSAACALVAATLLLAPRPALAQADWTFNIPMTVSNLPDAVDGGAMLCLVSTYSIDGAYVTNAIDEFAEALTMGIGPGQDATGFPGATPPEHFIGFGLFTPVNGKAPSQIAVRIVAPAGTTATEKLAAEYWACTLALRLDGVWTSPHPSHADPAVADLVSALLTPADGSSPAIWHQGTLGG